MLLARWVTLIQSKSPKVIYCPFSKMASLQIISKFLVLTSVLLCRYFACNRLTERSDVYSFGIVLLEIITGQPALQKRAGPVHIVQWVSPLLEKGDIKSIVDPRVQGNFDTNSVWKAVETAMACVPLNSNQRPTMSEVMMELKDCLEMQTAYEQNSAMWDQSSLKFQMSPTGLETEVLPLAR